MIEAPVVVVETQEKRAYDPARAGVAKTSHDAVRRSHTFDLDHRAFAFKVGAVQAFGDDAFQTALGQPGFGARSLGCAH